MDFDLSPADLAFRDEFRAWLAANKPPDIDVASDFKEAETLREWQRLLCSGRGVGVHWRAQYGRRGAPRVPVAIYKDALARAHPPRLLGRRRPQAGGRQGGRHALSPRGRTC